MPITAAAVETAIRQSLSPDLLDAKWRALVGPDAPAVAGHCAVASEAFYHLAGGKEAGFIPVVCGYHNDGRGALDFGRPAPDGWRKETHWWIRGPLNGERGKGAIHDITAGQYPGPFPYDHGRPTGFMQPQRLPSRRAQVVIDRVRERLGADALDAWRRANIAAHFGLAPGGRDRPKPVRPPRP